MLAFVVKAISLEVVLFLHHSFLRSFNSRYFIEWYIFLSFFYALVKAAKTSIILHSMRFYYLLTCFLFQLSSASPVDTFPKVAQILPRTTDAPFEDIEREPIDVFNYTQLPKYVKHGDWTSLNCSVYETSIGGRSVWRRSTPQVR
jgi:hypothetical protein